MRNKHLEISDLNGNQVSVSSKPKQMSCAQWFVINLC